MAMLEMIEVVKRYRGPGGELKTVLDLPAFAMEAGEQVGLAGPSGSGKTTFLHLIAGILLPDGGRVELDGVNLPDLAESERDHKRAKAVGIVYQELHLLPTYSAMENVLLGMAFGRGEDPPRAGALLERLGLSEHLDHRPSQMSLGQRQRVAVARALAGQPRLVLADEPTGSLDPPAAREALALLREVCGEQGAALLLVSHDPAVLGEFERCEDLVQLQRQPPWE